jgi:protein-disulfide isomerase
MKRSLLLLAACLAFTSPAASAPKGSVIQVEHHDPSALPTKGPPDALVTIEVFFTPGPSSRQQAYRNLERLQANHPTRIRLVYRIVPSGGQARTPYLAMYAHVEGKFFELMDALHAAMAQSPRNGLSDKELMDIAKKVGLDPDRVAAAWTKPPRAFDDVLEQNELRRKQRLHGQQGLPSALFNGRMPTTQLGALGMNDLENQYRLAKDLAEDMLDRGADRGSLAQAFDEVVDPPADVIIQTGPTDEDLGDDPGEPVLAKPPLDLRGLPSYGPADAATTVVVLCSPTSSNCMQPMRAARNIRDAYPDQVRVVWAPYFDLTREDAAELALLSDAALCAEKVGVTLEDRDETFGNAASPGWRWIDVVLSSNRRRVPPDKILDQVATKLRVDRRAFATCRAQLAGTSVAWIEAARRSGVRVTPSTVVGGRIYGPIVDQNTLQLLVEAELAPGILGEAAPSWRGTDSVR